MSTTPATERQISYVRDLLATRVVSDEVRTTVNFDNLDKSRASALIETLKALPYAPRAPRAGAPAPVVLTEGIYFFNDEVFKVKHSRAGRAYALKLIGSSWSYDPAHVRGIQAENLITLEQASAFGIRTGVCAICGAELTNLESLERGIGPVCAGRF